MELISQPLNTSRTTLDVIKHELNKTNLTQIWIVVAWAKASGLKLIENDMILARARGVTSKIIIGIDEGGATVEGIDLAIRLFDDCYIYNNPSRGTFHPKIYRFVHQGESIMIGSSNMTFGGLTYNYETNVLIDDGNADFPQISGDMNNYINGLINDANCIQRIDSANKNLFYNDPRLRISTESARRSSGLPTIISSAARRFGNTNLSLNPVQRVRRQSHQGSGVQPSVPAPSLVTVGPSAPSSSSVMRRWWKQLSQTDAQQVPAGTNPTGNLRLSKGQNNIPWQTYFRSTFFSGLTWHTVAPTSSVMSTKEEANFNADVYFDGIFYGNFSMKVSHAPSRVAGQNNVATVLHWGTLLPALTSTNYDGGFVSLEVDLNGNYTIRVDRALPSNPVSIP